MIANVPCKREESRETELVVLEQIAFALQSASDLTAVRGIRDKAEAVRKYAQTAQLGLEAQNAVAEIKLQAERKVGALLQNLVVKGGHGKSRHKRGLVPLEELGISKHQSSRWQMEASVPDDEFREFVKRTREQGRELTSASLINMAKYRRRPTTVSPVRPDEPVNFDRTASAVLEELRNHCAVLNGIVKPLYESDQKHQLETADRRMLQRLLRDFETTINELQQYIEGSSRNDDESNRLTSVQKSGTREVAMYDFESDEGGQAVDILGHALTGQFFGDVALAKAHNDGQEDSEYALEFDGNGDYVSLGIQDLFAVPSTGFTLMAWIKPQATSSLMGIASFGTMPGTTNSGYRFYYVGTSSAEKVIFQINDGSGTPQSITYNISGSIQDEWHHVAVTIDAFSQSTPQIRLFFDGSQVEAATFTKTGAWGVADQPFTIGATNGGTAGNFTGLIDDVRVVPGAFSQGHIAYAMTTAVPTLYLLSTVEYTYDHQNRLLSRYVEVNAPFGSPTETVEYYIHDGAGQSTTSARLAPDNLEQVGQIVLRLDDDGNVLNRYLWGPEVDQLVADEQVSDPQEPGEVLWALTDHLGTIRDLVRYDSGEGEVVPVVHRAYDGFGNVTEGIRTEAVDVLFGFTGRPFDEVTGLQNNLNRWYDPKVGRWVSEDPIGFDGIDHNLVRYVANRLPSGGDPSGLQQSVDLSFLDDWLSGNVSEGPPSGKQDFPTRHPMFATYELSECERVSIFDVNGDGVVDEKDNKSPPDYPRIIDPFRKPGPYLPQPLPPFKLKLWREGGGTVLIGPEIPTPVPRK